MNSVNGVNSVNGMSGTSGTSGTSGVNGTSDMRGTSGIALGGLPRTVLRLHRRALLVWAAFVVAVTGSLVWLTEVTADATRKADLVCRATGSCGDSFLALSYGDANRLIGTALGHGFLAVAAFAGAALTGRELESGTAQLAWMQGFSPLRWLTAKLTVPALALTAGGTVLVLVYRWSWAADRDLLGHDWTSADVFTARGPLLVAYALCALAVGALAGLLLRRSLAALGTAVAMTWLLSLVLSGVRSQLWPAVTRHAQGRVHGPAHSWYLRSGHDAHGSFAVYHPESHFWPLHLVETGIVLAVAAVATTAAYAVLRRRTA
ncbi:hypothetical protein ACJ6WF_19525 [Streptomyces sp. MMS24-I2-30]|uniref:hypothetical protein n=1 Tax=Streptomyces sp. MMS24-I2-30 TaxID=3351564 RepID=UPI003896BBF3